MTPSKATRAKAFAGKALKKHGTKPLQKPLGPSLRHISFAASFHLGNRLSPSLSAPPSGSVMIRCLTTSDGYEVSQKTWAERPPAQKLMEGVESCVWSEK